MCRITLLRETMTGKLIRGLLRTGAEKRSLKIKMPWYNVSVGKIYVEIASDLPVDVTDNNLLRTLRFENRVNPT